MQNKFYVAQLINADPTNLNEHEKLKIVSFDISVLDKYTNNSDYQILLDTDVGTLSSNKDGWSLQIDVNHNCSHVNTWLYCMGSLPDVEQQHFAQHNIYARKLSQVAHRRWAQGLP